MNIIQRAHAWWDNRNLANRYSPIYCNIHTGDTLQKVRGFRIQHDDAISIDVNHLGSITSVAIDLPAASARGVGITSIDDNKAVFVVIYNTNDRGRDQWLRMKSWSIDEGRLRAHFSREYESLRWNDYNGYPGGRYVERLIEPSPPVPFDEHHPHYEGSAQQRHDRAGAA